MRISVRKILISILPLCIACSLGSDPGPPLDAKPKTIAEIDAGALDDAELNRLADTFREYLDSTWRPASPVNFYGRRLRKLTKSFRTVGGVPFSYEVYLTPQINAFSLPDGAIRITGGLLDLLSDEEAMYVLAQQITHVKEGVSRQRFEAAAAIVDIESVDGLSAPKLISLETAFFNIQINPEQQLAAEEYAKAFLKNNRFPQDSIAAAAAKLAALNPQSGFRKAYPISSEGAELQAAESVTAETDSFHSPEADTSDQPPLSAEAAEDFSDIAEIQPPSGGTKTATLKAKAPSAASAEPAAISRDPAPELQSDLPPASAPAQTSVAALDAVLPGWYLQVAAETDSQRAEHRRSLLESASLPVMIQKASVNGVLYYRVLLGPYSARAAAERNRSQVMSLGAAKGTPFTKRVAAE